MSWLLSVAREVPIDVMPYRTVLLLVVTTNIVSPPGRLHEEDEVMIGNGNVLQPRLPLVRVPEMFFQHCFHLLDCLGGLLLKHLISDGIREHMAGDVPRPGRCRRQR